ncbi:MAG: hypothetical protein HQM16_03535 [Deltaproteobacteria bacterium]|nr:hypothetical protein [Deltaproteobacteria bacterium]
MKYFFKLCAVLLPLLLCPALPFAQEHLFPIKNSVSLSTAQKQNIIDYVRALRANKPADQRTAILPELEQLKNPVILFSLDYDGNLLGHARVDHNGRPLSERLKAALSEVSTQVKNSASTKNTPSFVKKIKLFGRPKDALDDFLHIQIIEYSSQSLNDGDGGLFDNRVYEPQVTGLVYQLKDKRAEITPLEAVMHNANAAVSQNYLARLLEVEPKTLAKNQDLKRELYRVIHFGEGLPDGHLTDFHRGLKIFTEDKVTSTEILNRLKLVGEWYAHNIINNEVVYEYFPSTGETRDTNRTMVRSTMAVWVLNKLAFYLNDDVLKNLGKETLHHYLEKYFNMTASLKQGRLYPSMIPTAIKETAYSRYATAGFLVMSILERGELATSQKEVALLMDWLMRFQQKDGTFVTQTPQNQFFTPGQVLLAVSRMYGATKEKKFLEFFDRSFAAYAPEIEAMMTLGNQRYTPYAPAWFTLTFFEMYQLTGDAKYRDGIFKINDRIIKYYELNARDQIYYDTDGMLIPKTGTFGNVSVTAALLESLAAAALTAKTAGDVARTNSYTAVIKKTTAYLMRLQYVPENTYGFKAKDRVIGGVKTDLIDNKTGMDNIGHLTNAFIKIHGAGLLP